MTICLSSLHHRQDELHAALPVPCLNRTSSWSERNQRIAFLRSVRMLSHRTGVSGCLALSSESIWNDESGRAVATAGATAGEIVFFAHAETDFVLISCLRRHLHHLHHHLRRSPHAGAPHALPVNTCTKRCIGPEGVEIAHTCDHMSPSPSPNHPTPGRWSDREGLAHVLTSHPSVLPTVASVQQKSAASTCNFELRRFSRAGTRSVCGAYLFRVVRDNGQLIGAKIMPK